MRYALLLLPLIVGAASAAEPAAAARRGYELLTQKPYLPPDFDQDTFDNVWRQWPEPLRSQAQQATPELRRQMAFERYGLTPRPDDPTKPLQYVVDSQGWTMNCFACHGGLIPDGQGGTRVWPGAPNSRFALQTLTEETRLVKAELHKTLSRMDVGGAFVPLGATNGTTNAVMFGVVLMGFRDANLVFHADRPVAKLTNHDMDAPPWWHFQRKRMLYIDGFAEKGHRGLMQFMLVRANGPEKFRHWEAEFRDVYAYLSSVEPPKYPYPIDEPLAERGRLAFNRVCADCHGTYSPLSRREGTVAKRWSAALPGVVAGAKQRSGAGQEGTEAADYPEKLVPIEEVATDRVRLDALTPAHRDAYGESWFAEFGKKKNLSDPGGYVAPPLDGIWASSPYFHNGSVPTLWHVLHPKQRPAVWRRTGDNFDTDKVGWEIETFERLPSEVVFTGWRKRQYFDTHRFGKTATGHDFPDALSADEKRSVLEYLKTL